MRKIVLFICFFLMFGCATNQTILVNRIADGYQMEKIAGDLPALYGGGYRYVKTVDGFKIESFAGCGSKYLYEKENITIEIRENSEQTRDYVYKDGKQETLLFRGKGEGPGYDIYPPYPGVFENNNIIYFFYYDKENLILNEVINGELKNPKYYPLINGEYEYNGFAFNEYEHYAIYKSDKNIKYVFEEKEYVFNKTDRVIFMKDIVFYSTFELSKPTGTYIINRKTNETIQFEENIDLILEPSYPYLPNAYNNKIKGNSILFMESVDGQSTYTYGKFIDNTFKMVRLPITYKETDHCSLYDENTIFYTDKDINANLNFHVITIK